MSKKKPSYIEIALDAEFSLPKKLRERYIKLLEQRAARFYADDNLDPLQVEEDLYDVYEEEDVQRKDVKDRYPNLTTAEQEEEKEYQDRLKWSKE